MLAMNTDAADAHHDRSKWDINLYLNCSYNISRALLTMIYRYDMTFTPRILCIIFLQILM